MIVPEIGGPVLEVALRGIEEQRPALPVQGQALGHGGRCASAPAIVSGSLSFNLLILQPSSVALEDFPVRLDNSSQVEVAEDYTKKKGVFRIKTQSGTECLFQADTEAALQTWVQAVEDLIQAVVVGPTVHDALPQPTTSHVPAAGPAYPFGGHLGPGDDPDASKRSSATGFPGAAPPQSASSRKLTLSRNRSPTDQSPASKNRKPSSGEINFDPGLIFSKLRVVRPYSV